MRTRILILASAACAMSACSAVSPFSSASGPESSGVSVSPSTAESMTPSPETSATASPEPTLGPGQFAAVVTENLLVRSAPGTSQDSSILPGYLTTPLSVYVVAGPVLRDGYTWYLVYPVYAGQLEVPPAGWAAAASRDGMETWLAADSYACGNPQRLADLIELAGPLKLACFGGLELTLEGILGGCQPGDFSWPGEETFCWVYRPGFDVRATPPPCADCFEPTLAILLDADFASVAALASGTPIVFRGHFDDPMAAMCVSSYADALPELTVFECRMTFVATDVSPLS